MFSLKKRIKSKPKPSKTKAINSQFDRASSQNTMFNVDESTITVPSNHNGKQFETTCPAYLDQKKGRLLIVEDECETKEIQPLQIIDDIETVNNAEDGDEAE